jgi:hypothetical protein
MSKKDTAPLIINSDDSPIEIADAGGVDNKKTRYDIFNDFLVVDGNGKRAVVHVKGYEVTGFSVNSVDAEGHPSPIDHQPLSQPWTLTINGNVMLSSKDNARILIDLSSRTPEGDDDFDLGFDKENITSLELIVGTTRVFPSPNQVLPAPGTVDCKIHYSNTSLTRAIRAAGVVADPKEAVKQTFSHLLTELKNSAPVETDPKRLFFPQGINLISVEADVGPAVKVVVKVAGPNVSNLDQ